MPGNLLSKRKINENKTAAVAAEIRVIYQPAVPTISTTLPGLVKNILIEIVVTIRLIAS
jgi:hypothetical protein